MTAGLKGTGTNFSSSTMVDCERQYEKVQSFKFAQTLCTVMYLKLKVKVKESRNRPGVAQRVPGGLGSQIFTTFST